MCTKSSSSYSYGKCCDVSNLGNYTNEQETQMTQTQKYKNRESVLNILIAGCPTPNNIKKCVEFTTSDKKKGVKIKSEN